MGRHAVKHYIIHDWSMLYGSYLSCCAGFGISTVLPAMHWLELLQLMSTVWVCQSVGPIPPEILKFPLDGNSPWLGTPVVCGLMPFV